jgi:hypothetical protein
MQQEIRTYYFRLILPAVICCLLLFILERLHINIFFGEVSKAGTVLFIILSACFSIVFPLWLRILFIRKFGGQTGVSVEQFLKFEKTFLLIAYVFKVPKAQMLFIALFGFYAVYYYFPSAKRIEHERKLFRVQG